MMQPQTTSTPRARRSSTNDLDPSKMSIASILKRMPVEQQRELVTRLGLVNRKLAAGATKAEIKEASEKLGFLDFLSDEDKAFLRYSWEFWARPDQLVDMNDPAWVTWLALAGRGWGKSRSGAEWVRDLAENNTRGFRIHLIGPTAADVRDIMVKGDSGILSVSPPWFMPVYSPTNRSVTWPNGVVATLFSAEEPDRLRGPQAHAAWCDEICAWDHAVDTWDMMLMGMRLGDQPRIMATTTPKNVPLLRRLIEEKTTRIVNGRTRDNQDNLAGNFLSAVVKRYEGTDLGRQELDGELLLENKHALWSRSLISATRVKPDDVNRDDLVSVVVAIDPAVSSQETSDECGIIVCGRLRTGKGLVLADRSGRYSPERWAKIALELYHEWEADRIVAEVNNGGDMVRHTIRTYNSGDINGAFVPFRAVRASRGKWTRAEPIAALFQQDRAGIVGVMPKLEEQLTTFDPMEGQKSPDRLDAMVWGLTDVMLTQRARWVI